MDKVLTELKDGDWKRVRNILVPGFTASKLKSIVPFIVNAGDDLVQRILEAEREGKTIDIWRTSGKYTMKVIVGTVFGVEIESREQEDKLTKAAGVLFKVNPLQMFLMKFMPWLMVIIGYCLNTEISLSMRYLVKNYSKRITGAKR